MKTIENLAGETQSSAISKPPKRFGFLYQFGFGQGGDIALPEGWKWIINPENWLMVEDGESNLHIVSDGGEFHRVEVSGMETRLVEDNPINRRPQ
jgi:hypothetical protein